MEDSVQQNGYITKHSQAVRAVAFHPEDKDLVVSAGEDGKIKLVSRATGTVRRMWTPNHGEALSVCFSSDGNSIAAGFSDGALMIFRWCLDDPQDGKEVCTLRGDKSSWVGVPAEISDLAQRVRDGTTDKSRSEAFVVTAEADHVFVYSLLENHHKLDGDNTKEAVAQYRAPANITNISCMGKCVCVGLVDGQVCKLYLNVQKHFTFAMKPVCMELADRKNQKKYSEQKIKKYSM